MWVPAPSSSSCPRDGGASHCRHCHVHFSLFLLFLLLLLTTTPVGAAASYDHCDSNAVLDSVSLSQLTPNTLTKICPAILKGKSLGQPICGDGTAFSFYVSRPTQTKANGDRKILLEFMGGGACWDAETCSMMSDRLTFPTELDNFLGFSCSEIQYGSHSNNNNNNNNNGDFPINMLCASQVGSTDFTEYTTIIVPYCTQDIHMGDNVMWYNEGSNAVNHYGAHNVMSVLRWMFRQVSHPTHVALTGCSAGATALPLVYDLIQKRYRSVLRGGNSGNDLSLAVVSDSPVYMTPLYFLQNGLPHWNPSTLMKRLRFSYDKYKYNTDYPTLVWNHILQRGSNRDRWGVVSHVQDETSLLYYQYMSGNGNGDGNNNNNNNDNNNNNNDDSQTWWTELSTSLSAVKAKHKNVDTYYLSSYAGHCSFGLYYALQEGGQDFEEWAHGIFQEVPSKWGRDPAVLLFWQGLFLGIVVTGLVWLAQRRLPAQQPRCMRVTLGFFRRFRRVPLTAAYFAMLLFYFLAMLLVEPFAHPLNNPSLGPSAVGLSHFGINNPTLMVYNYEYGRLLVSNFLCSGVWTFGLVAYVLWNSTRRLEAALLMRGNRHVFGVVALGVIGLGCNLVYALFQSGASCASVALVLGINAWSLGMPQQQQQQQSDKKEPFEPEAEIAATRYSQSQEEELDRRQGQQDDDDEEEEEVEEDTTLFPKPWISTIVIFLVTVLFFPFHNWVMLSSALLIGYLVAPQCISWQEQHQQPPPLQLRVWPCRIVAMVYIVLFLVLVLARHPDERYKYPFLTGCELVYTTNVKDIVQVYTGGNNNENGNRRFLQEDDKNNDEEEYANLCAQLCIPHVAYRPIKWGIQKFAFFDVTEGTCEEQEAANGYSYYNVHVADKTFTYATYSLDVELYSTDDDDNNNNNNNNNGGE